MMTYPLVVIMVTGIGIGIGVAVVALVLLSIGAIVVKRYRRTHRTELPEELEVRRGVLIERIDAIMTRIPRRSPLGSSEVPVHPRAAMIEVNLLAGNIRGALLEAEAILLEAPSDPDVHVLLARVLIHCDELSAVTSELARARRYGASGPMVDYLEARVQHSHLQKHTQFSKGDHLFDASPLDLLSPFELFMLELDRQRRMPRKVFAHWLSFAKDSPGRISVDSEDVLALMNKHFSGYYDCLDKLVAAVEREPAFTDALYHLARMALRVGFEEQWRELMEKLEPLMDASTERRFYERDLSQLRDDDANVLTAFRPFRTDESRPLHS